MKHKNYQKPLKTIKILLNDTCTLHISTIIGFFSIIIIDFRNDDSFTPHALRRPNGTTVIVEFEKPTSASVYVTVDQASCATY